MAEIVRERDGLGEVFPRRAVIPRHMGLAVVGADPEQALDEPACHHQLAEHSGVYHFFGDFPDAVRGMFAVDGEDAARFLGHFDHASGFVDGKRHRLFDVHVLAGPHRGNANLGVLLHSRAADDRVQVVALEHQRATDQLHGEIETEHPGYLGSQDTYYVGTIKGIGRIYQQTFVDTYSKVAACKLYTTKTPITAADLLNDRVLPMLEENGVGLLRILTDRGTEYCGRPERHDYQLYLAVNDIDHTKTKAYSPQTNGICERFHRTVKEEFYEITFRKNLYTELEALQADLDAWVESYNTERCHQGKMCCGRTPMQTLLDGRELWEAKVSGLN